MLARDWIAPRWFAHIDAAVRRAGSLDVSDCMAIVLCDTRRDPATASAFMFAASELGWRLQLCHCDEFRHGDRREWGPTRYARMVVLRNALLGEVRQVAPDWFWSVDSDVLVAELALESAMHAASSGFDAVGSRCYMSSQSTRYPNNAVELLEGRLRRVDFDVVIAVEVIMAAKLMSPAAYKVDYEVHPRGEDIGWSIAARAQGCTLGWDGRVVSKHVMEPAHLSAVDPRCGY